jgi:hypothetical protein
MSGEDWQQFGIQLKQQYWRISRKNFMPMAVPPREMQGRSRYDDPHIGSPDDPGGYAVLYVAAEPLGAFLEVIYQFRPQLDDMRTLASGMVIDATDRDQFLRAPARVHPGWIADSQLIFAHFTSTQPVFDLTSAATVQMLRAQFALSLIALGVDDLDFGHVLSHNRELTQAISRWVWSMHDDDGQPLFSGIRYRSRFDPECICLALYEDRYHIEGDVDIQPITSETPGFLEAATTLRLSIA